MLITQKSRLFGGPDELPREAGFAGAPIRHPKRQAFWGPRQRGKKKEERTLPRTARAKRAVRGIHDEPSLRGPEVPVAIH